MLRQFSLCLTAVAGITLLAANRAAGDEPADLAAAAREAQANYVPVTPEQVAQAKAELAAATAELDAMLRRSGPQVDAGWKRFLGWDNLATLLKQEEPPSEKVLGELVEKFRANHNGLEMKKFLRTRDALVNYSNVALAAGNEKLQDTTKAQLDLLATHLDAYAKNTASGDDALAIGKALEFLRSSRQAGELVQAVAARYHAPNLLGSASKEFLAAGMENDVDETTGVRDNILGTSIFGTARMTGRTTLVMNEDPLAASFRILLNGTAVSNNMGYNGPVTIHNTGVTSIAASKHIQVNADGWSHRAAAANARTNTTIHSISARSPMIERIAWNRAGQQKSQAEAIGSSRAAGRVAARMNQKAGEMVAEQNERYLEKFKYPLVRRGQFPELLKFNSTAARAYMTMLQAGPAQLAAPAPPPTGDAPTDVYVQAHESVVVNFGQAVLGGYEMTDLRLEKLYRDDLKAEVPEDLRVTLPDGTLDLDKDPWSITFASVLPLRAKFQDGGLWIAIRADGFARGEGPTPGKYKPSLRELIEISAAYKIERTDKGATLKRDGDVVVSFPDAKPGERSAARVGASAFLKVKFRNLFKEEFVGEGLKMKGEWADVGTLPLKDLKSDQAWLTLGWVLPPPAAAAPATAAGGE
jgi:hypothetical protein